jgi:hypothetical protein
VRHQQRVDDRTARVEERNAARDARQADRQNQRAERQDRVTRPPVVSVTPRPGTQPPPPMTSRPTKAPSWSTSWRHNNKYDWQHWRRHHHSWFHLGFYYDPFGWGYSPYSIGWRMWPAYYGSRYWIQNPWYYRLPYAPPGYQWIRYYNDALLVDTWSGEVVDVIYNFFW